MTAVTKQARLSGYQGGVVLIDLFISDCPACGVLFGITTDFEKRRRDDGGTFYCPAGHSMSFGNGLKEKNKQLERELKRAKEDEQWWHERYRDESEGHKTTKNQLRATKGVLTKTKKRAAAALCPVDGCKRQIVQMKRHLAAVHPDYKPEEA